MLGFHGSCADAARGNAADVFPGPFSPLAYDLILRDGMSKGLRDAYTAANAVMPWVRN